MAETHYKLRSDLEIHPEQSSGESKRSLGEPKHSLGVIIKDPVTKRFLRFSPVQASALKLLNGQMDCEAIAAEVAKKHQVEVLPKQIEEFAEKLRMLLLLDHPYCLEQLERIPEKTSGRFRNILHIKIHTFNPDRLLSFIESKSHFFFSLPFQYLFSIIALVALYISILHWESLFNSLGTLFSLNSIPLILLVVIVGATIHELAHGIALKHYGGKVEEMGIMFLYFIPALFCNVSDSWTLKKRQRIIVALAGGYIQIFIWAVATLLWRLLAPDTLISHICLISIMFDGLLSIFNLNPLIRLDGYYMLSDFVEIPNLRPKALSYLKHRWLTFLTGSAYAGHVVSNRREKRILSLYGTASFLFTTGLILYMSYIISGWMVREYKTWGVIMASVLFAMAAPAATKVKVSASGKFFKAIFMRLRKSPKLSILILFVLLGAFFRWELKISSDFTIVPFQEVSVTPQVQGHIVKIHVDEGSRVSVNSVLAEIENLELMDNYQEIRGELASQRASLDLLRAGTRPEEIERTRRLIATKKAEYENSGKIDEERAVLMETIEKKYVELEKARSDFERNQRLLENRLISRNEADRYNAVYGVQKKELSVAQGQLKVLEEKTERTRDIKRKELAYAESELQLLLAGTRIESIRAAESQVEKLESKLAILEKELAHQKIRSPIDGLVATPYLRNRIGDYLDKGDVLCKIVSEGKVQVKMPIPEKEIGDIQVDFPITMKVRGYPRKTYQSRVQEIAPVTTETESGKKVVVYGELDNSDGSLKGGMTGIGKILCGKRMILDIASRRAIRWLRTEFWEYIP